MNKKKLATDDFVSNWHAERNEGTISGFFAFIQNDNECQKGRSMVEMLGVLAVMGVLSVGGVAMYTNAMNKYKANELLNEASKRAVVVATRAVSGQTSIPLTEFSGNSQVAGGTFADDEAVDVSGNTFAIKIKGVDSAVCTQMKNSIGSNTVVREIPETCGTETISLVFNKDLSTSAVQAESLIDTSIDNQEDCQNAGKTWCYDAIENNSEKGVCSNVTDCCKTVTLNSCQTCQSVQGQYVVDYKFTGASCNFQGTNDGQCLPYAPTGITGCGATNIQKMCLNNMQYAQSETEKSCLPVPCSITGTCCKATDDFGTEDEGTYDIYGSEGLDNLMVRLQEALRHNDFSAGVAVVDQINVAQCTSCDSTDGSLTSAPDETSCYYLEGETLLQNYSNINNFTDVTLPGTCKSGKCSYTKPEGFCDYYTNGQYIVSPKGGKCHKYYSCDEPDPIWIDDSNELRDECLACGRKLATVGEEDSTYCLPKTSIIEDLFFINKDTAGSTIFDAFSCRILGSYDSPSKSSCEDGCKNTPFQRQYDENTGKCILDSCPIGYFSGGRYCIPCNVQDEDRTRSVVVDINTKMAGVYFLDGNETDCQKCANDGAHVRTFVSDDNNEWGICRY